MKEEFKIEQKEEQQRENKEINSQDQYKIKLREVEESREKYNKVQQSSRK